MPSPLYVPIYECPKGCKAAGNKPIAATIRGWKKHMTKQHGGFSDEELSAIIASVPMPSSPSGSESGKDAFLKENEAPLPGAIPIDRPRNTPEEEQAKAVKIKTDEMAKRYNQRINKMRKRISEALPRAVGEAVKKKGPIWQLSQDDSELLSESVENSLDVLDIDFQITPISATLTNPLWVLLLPFLALLLIFVPKAMLAAEEERGQENAISVQERGSDTD
jgi:hypothetical protein